jgi:hypothetical protein
MFTPIPVRILSTNGKPTVVEVRAFAKYPEFEKNHGQLPNDPKLYAISLGEAYTLQDVRGLKDRARKILSWNVIFFGLFDPNTQKWYDTVEKTTGKLRYAQNPA